MESQNLNVECVEGDFKCLVIRRIISRIDSVVKSDFAIITPQGRVINTIPGIVDAKMTILCSPKIGAGFVQLIGTLGPDARTEYPYATLPHEESFLYVLDGEIELEADVAGEKKNLTQGGYCYAPAERYRLA